MEKRKVEYTLLQAINSIYKYTRNMIKKNNVRRVLVSEIIYTDDVVIIARMESDLQNLLLVVAKNQIRTKINIDRGELEPEIDNRITNTNKIYYALNKAFVWEKVLMNTSD